MRVLVSSQSTYELKQTVQDQADHPRSSRPCRIKQTIQNNKKTSRPCRNKQAGQSKAGRPFKIKQTMQNQTDHLSRTPADLLNGPFKVSYSPIRKCPITDLTTYQIYPRTRTQNNQHKQKKIHTPRHAPPTTLTLGRGPLRCNRDRGSPATPICTGCVPENKTHSPRLSGFGGSLSFQLVTSPD